MQPMASIDVGAYVIGLTKARREAVVRAIQLTCATRAPMEIQKVVDATKPLPVDRGTYRRGFKVRDLRDGAMIYNSVLHAPIIEWGRRAGKMPPIDAITDWVIRKGMVPHVRRGKKGAGWTVWDQRQAAQQIAWLIARKMKATAREGKHILGQALGAINSAVMLAVHAAAEGR